MSLTTQIAKQLRDLCSGKNWTASNMKQHLTGITWQQATLRVHSFNSIASLVFHMNYYVRAVTNVLMGGTLNANDKYSFDLSPIQSQEDWDDLLNETWTDTERFATLIENLQDDKLNEVFAEEKYGTYLRNIHGVIEHMHYHLGQIVLIRKLVTE